MVNIKFYLATILFAVTLSFGWSQTFSIHLNQSFYIVGQTLSFAVYPHKDLLIDSMLIYTELYSPGSELKQQRIYRLHSRSVEGSMELPILYEEGNYILTCYALMDTGRFSSQPLYTSINVPIYNNLEEKPEELEKLDYPQPPIENINHEDSFYTRNTYTWSINLLPLSEHPQDGEYSVSIFKYEGFYTNAEMVSQSESTVSKGEIIASTIRKNIFLDGKLNDRLNGKNITEKYLSLYLPQTGAFHRMQATAGMVKMALPDIYNVQKAQLLSMNPNQRLNLGWNPVTSYFNVDWINDRNRKLERNQTVNYVLWQDSKRRLIEDIFKITAPSVITPIDTIKTIPPDKSYLLSDYKDLKSLRNFIKEVMIDCRISKVVNDRQSLRLRNKDLNQLYRWPAWYLVNGFFVGDDSLMLNLQLADIKQIDLYNRNTTFDQQFDPMMAYTGVIAINTTSNIETAQNVFPLNGLSLERPATTSMLASTLPDLRTQIYWSSKLKADQSGKLNVGFATSDVKGIYAVEVHGVDGRKVPVSKRVFIEVR